jgi:LmbE family N-acetylglucosaminyl deacetylase
MYLLLFVLTATVLAAPVPLNLTQFANKRILFVVAHPDDVEGLSGGLISLLSKQQGIEIAYLVATNGDKGGTCYADPSYPYCTKEVLALTRQKEQLNAAAYFNIPHGNVRFLDLEDGMLASYPEQVVRLSMVAFMRTFKPHVVFTWFPSPNFKCPPLKASLPYSWGDLGYHPDHMQSGKLCLDAVLGFGVSSNLIFDELSNAGVAPWDGIEQFYMFALTSPEMTHYVDIAGTPIDDKINALLEHKSQFVDPKLVKAGITWIAEQVGAAAGVHLAEGFTAFY